MSTADYVFVGLLVTGNITSLYLFVRARRETGHLLVSTAKTTARVCYGLFSILVIRIAVTVCGFFLDFYSPHTVGRALALGKAISESINSIALFAVFFAPPILINIVIRKRARGSIISVQQQDNQV